jgi:hypothetical protein
MSANSTTAFSKLPVGGSEYVRVMLKRLDSERRLWNVSGRVLMGMTAVLAVAWFLGLVDLFLSLGRAQRVVFVSLLLLCAFALIVYAVLSFTRRATLTEMALVIERATSQKENALATYTEAVDDVQVASLRPYMLSRLEGQARRVLENTDARVIAPRRTVVRSLCALGFVLFLILASRVAAPAAFSHEWRRIVLLERDNIVSGNLDRPGGANTSSNAILVEKMNVRVVPPAYSGLSTEEAFGDARLRVLAGSRIDVELDTSGNVTGAALGFGGATIQMRTLGEGRFSGSFVPDASGAFETRVLAEDQPTPSPVVRAIEVYADVPPEARITEPTSDQLLRGVPSAPISVNWTARDDLGLGNVVLKYIRSRGEGDAAQFVNGVVPLSGVEHINSREWRGGAKIELSRLGLQPGDTLVYWIEAQDRNPSANNMGRSASLAIAIIAPEPVKLNLGDLGPTEIGKFLLSQRMIIIHTEKLHAERARVQREEFLKRAQGIAAEQRDFKNSFNEYIRFEGSGEEVHQGSTAQESVEDRVQEAEEERTGVHMHGIPEPPSGSPSSVRDMVYAIRAMWDAEDALSQGDTTKALGFEREALTRLKRAQLAVRYVPPVVARSKPIDLKRRYAGELNEIKTRLEKLSRPSESKDKTALRAALADTYAGLSDVHRTLDVPATARSGAIARARERAQQAANNLAAVGGDHASTIAQAMGQLRIVETELSQIDVNGTGDVYASRVNKVMSLLTQAAANLFAIAEARTRANGVETDAVLPADDRRTSDYFRRLNK